jgi:alpha-L-rhamnosidase
VAAHVASLDISVEPDHGMEVLRALHAGGRDADVVRILTDPSFPGWAAIIESGGTFTWETWTPSDVIGDSMSHGWGSSALVAMQEALLGVVPTVPSPAGPPTLVTVGRPGAWLTHAAGTFPTPAGQFAVSWHTGGPATRLLLTVPPNAGATCRLPATAVSGVREGGLPVDRAPGVRVVAAGPSTVDVLVGAGRYDFEARSD